MTNDKDDCFGVLYDENALECQKCKDAKLCKRKQFGEPDPTLLDQPFRNEKKGEGLKPELAIKVPDPNNPVWKKVRDCLKNWVNKDMILEKVPELKKEVLEVMIYRLAPALEKEARWHIEK